MTPYPARALLPRSLHQPPVRRLPQPPLPPQGARLMFFPSSGRDGMLRFRVAISSELGYTILESQYKAIHCIVKVEGLKLPGLVKFRFLPQPKSFHLLPTLVQQLALQNKVLFNQLSLLLSPSFRLRARSLSQPFPRLIDS